MKLDLLVLAAHPDDAELSCSGTIISHVSQGYKVGVVDFTRGELGTRGTPEIRLEESNKASEIMGLSVRENLELPDGFLKNDKEAQLKVITAIRKYQPSIVLSNAIDDRHPNHGEAARLANDSVFFSGLAKIETVAEGTAQKAWRPSFHYHYIQDRYINPDFIIDISPYWDQKMNAIMAFRSQFYDPQSKEKDTYISSKGFLDFLQARSIEMGHAIGVKYGEGFTSARKLGLSDIFHLK